MQRPLQLATRRFSATPKYWPGNYASFMLQHIENGARASASRPALIDGVSGRITTYRDLPYRIGAAARGFKALGITRGTVVGLHLANSPEFIVAFNALAALGAVVTTSNPAYSPTELTHQLRDSGASFVLTMEPLLPVVSAAAAGVGLPASRVLVLGSPAVAFLFEDVAAAGALRGLPEVEAVDGPRTLLALPYSSGTTGLPKGVELSHGNLTANLEQSHPGLGMASGDVAVGVLPLYHIYGITCIMGLPLRMGGTVVTLPKFDPVQFLTAVQKYRSNFLFIVPPIIAFLAKHPAVAGFDLSHVNHIFSGAAPLDGDTQRAVEARFPHAAVRQGYGMTEASPITHSETTAFRRPGSVGHALVDTECRIVEAGSLDRVLPRGRAHVGELQLRGPQVMMGYHNNAKATADTVLPGGWLRTGDLVCADEDGVYYVVDRLKELIKCKGLQVAPAELEGLLLGHPLLYDAAVVPKADERAGEVPVAFVVTRAALLRGMGKAAEADALPKVTAEQVQAFVAGKVADYKRLAEVHFVDAIPKNPSGKSAWRGARPNTPPSAPLTHTHTQTRARHAL